jgi:hypothetical protein
MLYGIREWIPDNACSVSGTTTGCSDSSAEIAGEREPSAAD